MTSTGQWHAASPCPTLIRSRLKYAAFTNSFMISERGCAGSSHARGATRTIATFAAVVGDRERANELAALIDARPGSPIVFGGVIFTCFCGAPFDLNVTSNYKARIEEAGVPWPPAKRIDYPTRTW